MVGGRDGVVVRGGRGEERKRGEERREKGNEKQTVEEFFPSFLLFKLKGEEGRERGEGETARRGEPGVGVGDECWGVRGETRGVWGEEERGVWGEEVRGEVRGEEVEGEDRGEEVEGEEWWKEGAGGGRREGEKGNKGGRERGLGGGTCFDVVGVKIAN